MFKDLKITLYDIFGYLLPGLVFLSGLAILYWAIWAPQHSIKLIALTTESWTFLLLIAYFAGHLAQSLGNLFPSIEDEVLSGKLSSRSLPPLLIKEIKIKASVLTGVVAEKLSNYWLSRICDEAVVQGGSPGDREIYQYREGFYRGLTVAFLILCLATFVRIMVPGTSLTISSTVHSVNASSLWLFLFLNLLASFFFYRRYRRFGTYRVTQALIAFLILPFSPTSEGEQKEI